MTQSDNLAAFWYRKAADQGHSSAQFNMAVLHLHGHGVERDAISAYSWLLLAQQQGHRPSTELMKELDDILNDEQRAEARRRSSEMSAQRVASD